ncbi:hypothetical protein F66182_6489 [Fusarium sp. NRRL 66182]|nr:hypothetical protein F66182_6489 [Fusarium sp. NRRL 66182]
MAQSTKPTLKITRVSALHQLDGLVDVAAEAFIDDPLFALIVPGRHENPESYRAMWQMHLREEYGNTGTVILAARDQESGEALAFGIWGRHGTSDVARSWHGDTWNMQFTRIRSMWDVFSSLILPQRTKGFSVGDVVEVVSGLKHAETLYPAERWRLCWLAVSPKCQRTGIGRRLVQWGLDRCDEEGVPAVLESSIPAQPVYEKMGFHEIGRMPFNKGKSSQAVMLRPAEETKKEV